MCKTIVAVLAAAMTLSPRLSRAEEFPGLAIGQTVRVTKTADPEANGAAQDARTAQTGPSRFRAEVVAMDEDSISLTTETGSDPIVVPRATIVKLEVSRGRSHARGAALGAGIGLAIGTIVGLSSGDDDCDPMRFDCANATGGNSTGKDALLGALAGGAVGAAIGVQRWESIDAGNTRLALTLPRRGVGAAIRISW